MITCLEAMRVVADASADIRGRRKEPLCHREILGGGDLQIQLLAHHRVDAQAREFGESHVIRHRPIAILPMRIKNSLEAKALWRLRALELVPCDSRPATVVPPPPERVCDWQKRNRCVRTGAQ